MFQLHLNMVSMLWLWSKEYFVNTFKTGSYNLLQEHFDILKNSAWIIVE